MKKTILIPVIAGLLLAASANGQNLITNGGFDTNTDWFFSGESRYDTDKGTYDWKTTTTPADSATNPGLFAYTSTISVTDGQQYLLEGDFSFIDNTFNTGEVRLYWEVDFLGSGTDIGGTAALAGTILLTDNDDSFGLTGLTGLNFTANDTEINEVKLRVDVITEATSAATTSYIIYDNVSLTAVPEPSTYAMIAGFLAFGFVAVRRRMATK